MKTDKYKPMTQRQVKQLAALGVTLPPETTIREANRIACSIIQPGAKREPEPEPLTVNSKPYKFGSVQSFHEIEFAQPETFIVPWVRWHPGRPDSIIWPPTWTRMAAQAIAANVKEL